MDAIVGERCDVGFIAQPNAYPSPRGEKIIQSSLRCALPFDHRLRDKAVIVPQDLEGGSASFPIRTRSPRANTLTPSLPRMGWSAG